MSEPISFSTFEAACAHLAKARGMSALDAMSTAARQHPDLVRKYNAEGQEIAKAARADAAPKPISKALLVFEDRVDQIAKRDGCPRYVAMERARERFPSEFSAAFETETA